MGALDHGLDHGLVLFPVRQKRVVHKRHEYEEEGNWMINFFKYLFFGMRIISDFF
jgi:hypothetical protein